MDAENAFQVLKSEIKTALNQIQAEGSQVFLKGNFDDAKKLADRAEQLEGFLKNINHMQREWKGLMTQPALLPGVKDRDPSKTYKAATGQKTHAKYFRIPILKALVEMGGSGKTAEVIDRVGDMLADQLNDYDKEELPSGYKLRWRNTAEWVRNTLKTEGLVSSQTPRGNWEITQAGIEYLKIRGD
ncbi:MAG: winged helix-turn-helix domain-containing protein [Bellilinea sp.]